MEEHILHSMEQGNDVLLIIHCMKATSYATLALNFTLKGAQQFSSGEGAQYEKNIICVLELKGTIPNYSKYLLA